MKKALTCLWAAFLLLSEARAQSTRYIIQFRDKGSNPYSFSNPLAYLSQKAIDRRTRYSIAMDSADLPVTPRYIDSVRLAGSVTILNASKWLNSVTIKTTDASALDKISRFPFVQAVSAVAARNAQVAGDKFALEEVTGERTTRTLADYFNYGSSHAQLAIHNGQFLHNIGLRGQSMIIGMLDAGFFQYTSLHAFDSVNANGQVLGIYDFVAKDNSVVEDDTHGMECFSTIAANMPGQFVGTAPKASFYLFRTEDASSEYPIEEHNWVCGAERVDSAGGDVISSSLGYNLFDNPAFNHTYADMNGRTTMAARGAEAAAKKGMLVVNAAGNEGTNSWHFIITPADGDSVLAVGAVDANGNPAAFSSYGPSSDGRVKPDVASVGVGTTVQAPNNSIGTNNGTSFACPNMAGLATCLWQGFREFNNMKILQAVRLAGSSATRPNTQIGYGIPDVRKALLLLLKEYATASTTGTGCTATVSWNSKDVSSMYYEVERKLPGDTAFTKVGRQQGTGSVFGAHSYQYTDEVASNPGTIQYRIRQVVDSSATGIVGDYIDTTSMTLGTGCSVTVNTVQVSPNPSHHLFSVRVTSVASIQELNVRMINNIGQTVYSVKTSAASGTTTINLPASRLASGKYYVQVFNGTQLLVTKEVLKL
jgi:serine protease AprX